MKSKCKCCREQYFPITAKWDRTTGFVCQDCFELLQIAEDALAFEGIVGCVIDKREGAKP